MFVDFRVKVIRNRGSNGGFRAKKDLKNRNNSHTLLNKLQQRRERKNLNMGSGGGKRHYSLSSYLVNVFNHVSERGAMVYRQWEAIVTKIRIEIKETGGGKLNPQN